MDQKLLTISSINFNFTELKSVAVLKKSPSLLSLDCVYPSSAQFHTETGDVHAVINITLENNALRFQSTPEWASNTTILLEDNGEHFFGILEPLYPNNRKSPDLRGEVVDVDVVGNASCYHENYATAYSAFFMTNQGYASFYDTFAAGKYKLGINGVTELYHRTNRLDWYIIRESSSDEILKTYYSIIGKPKFVPMWACGPIGWRDENKGGKKEILDDVQKMTDLKIPFTAWWVDRPYSHGAHEWSKMDFSEKFSDPKEWIRILREEYGLHFMTWIGTLTRDDDFPGKFPSQEGYFDLTNPAAVKEFGNRLKSYQYSVGVQGHKMDRADEFFPQMYPWYDKTPVAERRNKYVFLFSKITDSLLRDSFDNDQFNFARSAFHRCQPYLSALWGGDSRSSWDGMAGSLANAIRCSFMGFPVWGSDVGGYLGGRISEKLFARWLQFGSWSGLYEIKLDDAGGKREDRIPWKYSEHLQNVFRECNARRMEFQTFIYSLANTSYKNGALMKPLAYMYPDDPKTYALWDEYLLGSAFLIAPILDSTDSRSVYLPKGTWLDYNDPAKSYQGNASINVSVPSDKCPVFIRTNSIYVTGIILAGNSNHWIKDSTKHSIHIHIFPGVSGESFFFDYVDYADGNKEKKLCLNRDTRSISFYSSSLPLNSILHIKADKKPSSVLCNGKIHSYSWDSKEGFITIKPGNDTSVEFVIIP
jgi:alpha-glucosidase (family GH31 glycosyl hydrolase)